jgi:pimeloyl-ACP methyl ester carboxylesterase
MRFFTFLLFFLATKILCAQSPGNISAYKTDSGYFTSFDKTKIYYEVRGEGYPVILIHGFIVTGASWKNTALLTALLKEGYKVIIPDLRGNGHSDKPRNEAAYASDAEAKDIMGLASFLNLNNYNVVGYSRGSIITARLLVLDKRVNKAVLGGMGTGFTDPNWPRRIQFYEALSGRPVRELQGMVDNVKKQGLDTMVLAYLQKEQPYTLPAALAQIKQKVLIICGDKDSDNGSAQDLKNMFPNASLTIVPGDHNNASKTVQFADAVQTFFK